MQTIRLPEDVDDREAVVWRELRGQPATAEHYDELVEGPARIEWADGSLAAVYDVVTSEVLDDELRSVLPTVEPASGIRTGGMPTRSRQFGARPRYPLRQREYCGRCTMERDYPDVYERLVALGAELARWYAEAQPDMLARQLEWLDAEVRPEYRMTGPYTSGIINLDNALPFHRDGGNVAGTWNAMAVVREDVIGGLFVAPAWRLAFAAGDRHALVLDAQRTTHGVTAVERVRVGGFRTSVVYYCLKALRVCGCRDDELARARQMRTLREERRAGLDDGP